MRNGKIRTCIAWMLALTAVLFLGAAVIPGGEEIALAQPAGGYTLRANPGRIPVAHVHAAVQQLWRVPLLGNSLLIGLSRWDVGPGLFTDWFFCLIVYILRALYGMDGIKRRRSAVNMRSVYN